MAHMNPAQVEQYLSGMNYPCNKDDVVSYAASHGADQNVLDTLQQMPGGTFQSMTDVSRAIGSIV